MGCSKLNWQNVTLWQGWIYTDQRQNSHRKASGISLGVFFCIVIRHGVKISMDGGFPYPQRFNSSGAGLLLPSIWAAHTHPSYKNTSALRAGKAQITGGGRRTCIGQGQWNSKWKSANLHGFLGCYIFLPVSVISGLWCTDWNTKEKRRKNKLARFFLAAQGHLQQFQ